MIWEGELSIVSGDGIGSKSLYPTINFVPDKSLKNIEFGVYAGQAMYKGINYPLAIHYGSRPSLKREKIRFETHWITSPENFPMNFEIIKISLIQKIRDIKKFDSLKKLKDQIFQDIEMIKSLIKNIS